VARPEQHDLQLSGLHAASTDERQIDFVHDLNKHVIWRTGQPTRDVLVAQMDDRRSRHARVEGFGSRLSFANT
jgi:hypothetical protein